MSRRRNGTNRAGTATGGNRYQGGYNKPKKCTAGAATPNGAEEKSIRNNYNIQIPVEQEKMQKVMELIQLAIGINGMSDRIQESTGNLPTIFINYSGHVSLLEFRVFRLGYVYKGKAETVDMYINTPIDKFNLEYDAIKAWLMEIKEGLPHELV